MISPMRNAPGIHAIGLLARPICLLLPLCAAAFGQDAPGAPAVPAQASPATPSDALHSNPAAFLIEAGKYTGLHGPDMPQWRLKASFKILDENRQVTDSGTFEVYQAEPGKYRMSYSSSGFTQTEYGTGRTDRAVFRTGAQTPAAYPLSELAPAFLSPLPTDKGVLSQFGLEVDDTRIAGLALSCVKLELKVLGVMDAPGGPPKPVVIGVYCFEPGKNDLKVSSHNLGGSMSVTVPTLLTKFEGRTIPTDFLVSRAGKPALTAHLENIEALSKIDPVFFIPPADAKLYPTMMVLPPPMGFGVAGMEGLGGGPGGFNHPPGPNGMPPKQVMISGGVAQGLLLEKTNPEYPAVAKAARVSGTVVLQAIISKTGSIEDLHVISGPPLLQGAAMDAVKTWRYRPYRFNGEPVEVQTTINVVFALGE
jgi:TonB family protein